MSFGLASLAAATGMQPETTVVIVEEATGEATINVKNTDTVPALLYTSVENIPEDKDHSLMLIITPPVARVEPGESQLVRFILHTLNPLKTERLRRVFFEGIPQRKPKSGSELNLTIRQNLPVLIRPKSLSLPVASWKLLQWSLDAHNRLRVQNPSPYVMRLSPILRLEPGRKTRVLPRAYLLPGETLTVGTPFAGDQVPLRSVWLSPISVYGRLMNACQAPLIPSAVQRAAAQAKRSKSA